MCRRLRSTFFAGRASVIVAAIQGQRYIVPWRDQPNAFADEDRHHADKEFVDGQCGADPSSAQEFRCGEGPGGLSECRHCTDWSRQIGRIPRLSRWVAFMQRRALRRHTVMPRTTPPDARIRGLLSSANSRCIVKDPSMPWFANDRRDFTYGRSTSTSVSVGDERRRFACETNLS